jgi:hypothetical protein
VGRPGVVAAAAAIVLSVAVTSASGQAGHVPASLALLVEAREAPEGAKVPVTVTLRNHENQPVEAPRQVVVTLASELMAGPARLIVRAGSRSGQTVLVFNRSGVAKIIATADDLPAAYGVVAVTPRTGSRSVLDDLPPLMAHAVNGLFPRLAAAAAQTGPAGARLWIEILPPRITPREGRWTGLVMVGLTDGTGTPLEALRDIPVRLAAQVGIVSPDHLVIPRGATTAAGDVRVTSSQAGHDVVHAASSAVGARAEQQVEYERLRPSKLFVTSTPVEVVSNGRTSVQIAVVLKDEDNHVVPNPGGEVRVVLGSTLGSLSRRVVTIARGRPDSEGVELWSRRAGQATITAEADGLERDEIGVRFALPWVLIALACGGGTLGGMLRSRGRRRRTLAIEDLGIGALLGMVFFALTLFGVPGVVPAVPLQTLDNLTLNEIGAFLLGVLGGYLGRDFLTRLLATARLPERRPAAVG